MKSKNKIFIVGIIILSVFILIGGFSLWFFNTEYYKKEQVYIDLFPKNRVSISSSISNYRETLKDNWSADPPTHKIIEYRPFNYWILGENKDLIYSTEWYDHILVKSNFKYPTLEFNNVSKICIKKYKFDGNFGVFKNVDWVEKEETFALDLSDLLLKQLADIVFDTKNYDVYPYDFLYKDVNQEEYLFRLYFKNIKGLFYQNIDIRITKDLNGDFWIVYGKDLKQENIFTKRLPDDLNKEIKTYIK